MTEQIFSYLSIIIGVVIITLSIMKILKQPMIIGYILAGTIISIFIPYLLHENIALETFSSIGISFLLFIVGLELNPKIIKDIGKTAIGAGVLQVTITAILGFILNIGLGFDYLTSLYIAIGLSFSSTIVILKLLSDKNNTETVFGKLSIGILIVQDILVMLLFIALSTIEQISQGSGGIFSITSILILKIIGIIIGLYIITKYLLPHVTKKIAETQEFLFLFAIGRCFILGSIFYTLGFSIEIGALVAGITLANSSYKFEIMSKVKPLRDFFIVLFFVLLGSRITFPIQSSLILPIIVLTLFVLLVKPLIVAIILGKFGHSKKNSFLSAMTLGQISEFSFIFIMMGISSGHIKDPNLLSFITIIGLLSITFSSYSILYGTQIYNKLKTTKLIKLLPGKNKKYKHTIPEHDILLFGHGRFGGQLLKSLNQSVKNKVLVVDEDPKIINSLEKKGIPCIYGDVGEIDFLDEINTQTTKMIISTVKNYDDNILLLKYIKQKHKNIIVIIISHNTEEAIEYYKEGADYIILPHYIGASHASGLLKSYGFDIDKFIQKKEEQLQELQKSHTHIKELINKLLFN